MTVNFLFGYNDNSILSHLGPHICMLSCVLTAAATSSELPGVSYTEIVKECCKKQSGGHVEKLIPTVSSVQYFNLA